MPTSASQPRQIRLFLSSTFRDMEKERHELLTRVFPLFRQMCLERQVVFSEIDLRWGITEEDAHNGQTVQICLEEIARCRALGIPPFFIGFIGERYGWVPQRHDLENYWHQAAQGENPYARRIEAALAEGISVTELEMRYGFMDNADGARGQRVQLYFRHPDLTATLAGEKPVDFYESTQTARDKLAALKRAIRETHAACIGIDGYQDISEFGQHILDFLVAQLDTHFPREAVPDEQWLRLHAQQCYALSRRESYVPLLAFKHQVETWAQNTLEAMLPDAIPDRDALNRLALVGDSGRGKSAFMADLVASDTFSTAQVIAHFVGADGDNSPEAWRERVLLTLQSYLPPEFDIPGESEARWAVFPELVGRAQMQMGKPIILLLDAINQFSPQEEGLRRLHDLRFSSGTLLVVTSTEPLSQEWPTLAFPELNEDNRREAIALFLHQYSKKLPEALVGQLVAAPVCANALFLRLVMEELRLHADHDSLATRVAALLSYEDAGQLFLALLNETDRDFRPEGDSLASQATTLIAASRAGLSHRDLAVLLAPHLHHAGPKMADQTLLRLLARITPFCLNDDGRLRITHTIFSHTLTVLSPLMSPSRRALVAWFNQVDAFSVAERTYQWMALENDEQLVETLGRVDAFCALQQSYPELASQAMLRLGAGRHSLPLLLNSLVESWNVYRPEVVFMPVMNVVSAWFLQRGFWLIGARWGELAATMARKKTPVDLINTMGTANSLSLFYRLLGQYDKAEPLLCDALALMRKMLPAGHPDICVVLNNLAGVYGSLGLPEKAEPLLREAHQYLRDENSIDFANITQSLGECYQDLEKYDQAESLLLQSLAVRERLQARDNPDLIALKCSLGELYMAQGRHDEAEPILLEVLARRKATLPPEHPHIATSTNDLGELYYRQGDVEKAEPLFTEMMDIRRKSLPPGHPELAGGLQYQAELYRSQERFDHAEPLMLEAIEILRHHQPALEESFLLALDNLAQMYLQGKDFAKALPLYEEMLVVWQQKTSAESLDAVLLILNNLGFLYQTQARVEDAERCWQMALNGLRSLPVDEGHRLESVLSNLVDLYTAQQRYQDALPLAQEHYALRCEKLPAGSVEIALAANSLAEVYYALEQYVEAEDYFREALAIIEGVLPDGHPEKNKLIMKINEVCEYNENHVAASHEAKRGFGEKLRSAWSKWVR